jgi:hypothetical protein
MSYLKLQKCFATYVALFPCCTREHPTWYTSSYDKVYRTQAAAFFTWTFYVFSRTYISRGEKG